MPVYKMYKRKYDVPIFHIAAPEIYCWLRIFICLVLVLLLEEYHVVAGIKSWHSRHFVCKRHKSTCKESIKHKMDFSTLVWKRRTIDIGLRGDWGQLFSMRESTFMKKRASKCIYYPVMLVYKCLLFFGATNQKTF